MKQCLSIVFFLFSALLSNERVGYILNVQGYVKIISDRTDVYTSEPDGWKIYF